MNSKQKSKLLLAELEDIKGRTISCIDVRKLTGITDYMVIATGTSSTHIKALSDAVIKKCKTSGLTIVGVEGRQHAEWVLVDVGDVVVHIMTASARELYSLEDLWSFGKPVAGLK
ncbi:MAG: ribosome silencing factor [Pseudohongiellaceae bacterium]